MAKKLEEVEEQEQPMSIVGRIVHYVMPRSGKHRPAVVVEDWGNGVVNLQVFTDQRNDGVMDNVMWVTSAPFSEDKEPATWHHRAQGD